MSEFQLFGRKIPLPHTQIPAKLQSRESCTEIAEVGTEGPEEEEFEEPDKQSSSGHDKDEIRTAEQANEAAKAKQDHTETNSTDQERVLKKPDKVIPCPRCNSSETKFCYFNNYNVNQPRHFCKNCQRYWTAGGTMRNVPIGAGRRKNKHLVSQYRQILLSSDGIPVTEIENSDSTSRQLISSSVESASALRPSTGNGVVLKFSSEAPLCESMENVLNLSDQKRFAEISSVSCRSNGEEPLSSCGSSMTASGVQSKDLSEMVVQKGRVGFPGSSSELIVPHPSHCYPVTPLVYPWTPGWSNGNATAAATCPTPTLAVPSFLPPTISLQFVPASYWGCMPLWAPGTGNMPLNGSNGCLSPSSSTSTGGCLGPGSPTLGKHYRDSDFSDEQNPEKCILVPKTLRIDDPNEASKSPLWATLGIKPDLKDPKSKGTIFETYMEGKGTIEATHVREANPAALSRSHTFHESS